MDASRSEPCPQGVFRRKLKNSSGGYAAAQPRNRSETDSKQGFPVRPRGDCPQSAAATPPLPCADQVRAENRLLAALGRGVRFVNARLDALRPTVTATIEFFFPFNFLVSHDDTPHFRPPRLKTPAAAVIRNQIGINARFVQRQGGLPPRAENGQIPPQVISIITGLAAPW